MSKQLELLQRTKHQLEQLQTLGDDIKDAFLSEDGFAGNITQNIKIVEGANTILQEIQDKWPGVQELLTSVSDQEAATAHSADAAAQAWQQVQAEQWQALAKSWSTEALKSLHTHLKSHIQRTDQGPAKRRRIGASREQSVAELKAVVGRVQAVVPAVQVHYCSAITSMTATPETANELRVICPKVLVANILLSGIGVAEPVRVVVDSIERAVESCGWSHSQHLVFRHVSALATRALCYFTNRAQQQHRPNSSTSVEATALEDLLLWLSTYQDLFSRPCTKSGKLLAWDPSSHVPVPPIFRPYVLTREELVKAASEESYRVAFHMQHVPVELLSWQMGGGGEHTTTAASN